MMLELRVVPSTEMVQAQRDAIVALCSEAFHCDYAYYLNLGLFSVHVLGYLGERLAAHALWLERRLRVGDGPWRPAAYVEGVATHAGFRGRGVGSAVLRRLQAEVGGFDLAALSPSDAGWYERLRWERWRGPLFIIKDGVAQATPDDEVMVYRTPRTGELDLDAALTGEWRPFELW
jgi:aminoglycoside 2'-N-acetyltransferase I